MDGYYRDAVASFSSSLERFYEFYIASILFKNGVSDNDIAENWKTVSNSSERQFGAFAFVYLLEEKIVPPGIESVKPKELGGKQFKNFRNNIIHRGDIPNKEQALCFGQTILDYIVPIFFSISEKKHGKTGENSHNALFSRNAQRLWDIVNEKKSVRNYDNTSGGSLPMILGPVPRSPDQKPVLSIYIDSIKAQRNL